MGRHSKPEAPASELPAAQPARPGSRLANSWPERRPRPAGQWFTDAQPPKPSKPQPPQPRPPQSRPVATNGAFTEPAASPAPPLRTGWATTVAVDPRPEDAPGTPAIPGAGAADPSAAEDQPGTPRADGDEPPTELFPRPRPATEDPTTTTTGSHRAIGTRRRRIAAWPIACFVFVVLVVVGWIGWNWADSAADSRAEAQANGCAEGDTTIRILVAPSAQQPVTAAATAWRERQENVVHGHCVNVDVAPESSGQALDLLLAGGGGNPAAWVPETSAHIDQLAEQRPDLIGSSAKALLEGEDAEYPYVTLAGKGIDDVQERAAQSFRAFLLKPAQVAAFASTTGG